jgi:hypothetical protein
MHASGKWINHGIIGNIDLDKYLIALRYLLINLNEISVLHAQLSSSMHKYFYIYFFENGGRESKPMDLRETF